ncbi:unnamed protein product, partial [Pylaiella littoralis]
IKNDIDAGSKVQPSKSSCTAARQTNLPGRLDVRSNLDGRRHGNRKEPGRGGHLTDRNCGVLYVHCLDTGDRSDRFSASVPSTCTYCLTHPRGEVLVLRVLS